MISDEVLKHILDHTESTYVKGRLDVDYMLHNQTERTGIKTICKCISMNRQKK